MLGFFAFAALFVGAVFILSFLWHTFNAEPYRIDSSDFSFFAIATIASLALFSFGLYFSEIKIAVSIRTFLENVYNSVGILGAAFYIVFGLGFSFANWINHVLKARDWMKESLTLEDTTDPSRKRFILDRELFNKSYQILEVSSHDGRTPLGGYAELAPRAFDFKWAIVSWGAWWPFFILRFLLKDAIKGIWNLLFRMFSGVFDAVSRTIFDGR